MTTFWSYEEGIQAGLYDPGTNANSPIKTDNMTLTGQPPRITVTPKSPNLSGMSGAGPGNLPGTPGTLSNGAGETVSLGGSPTLDKIGTGFANFFSRFVIIVLGFIFVAAGLYAIREKPLAIAMGKA